MMPPGAKTAPEAVVRNLSCLCATSEFRTLACKCRKNLRLCLNYCACANTSCWNDCNEDEDDSVREDDSHSDSDSEAETFF